MFSKEDQIRGTRRWANIFLRINIRLNQFVLLELCVVRLFAAPHEKLDTPEPGGLDPQTGPKIASSYVEAILRNSEAYFEIGV